MSKTGKCRFGDGTSHKTSGGNVIGEPRSERVAVNLTVNGRVYPITNEPRTTLLDALREELGLTGTKRACDRGVRRMHRACRRAPRLVLYDARSDACRASGSAPSKGWNRRAISMPSRWRSPIAVEKLL